MDPVTFALGVALLTLVLLCLASFFVAWECPVCHGRRREPVDGSCLSCRYVSWY